MARAVVSVVIRAFNCEKYIGQAIESVLNQTFQDFEIVVVDDSSTDGTEAILKSYVQQDGRIRVFRNESNLGPVRTMNHCLKNARCEFVAVQDADDISLPHRLETQVNFLRANPQVALMGGGAFHIDEEGEEVKIVNWGYKETKAVRQLLREGHTFNHSSVMFRREKVEAIGLYDEFFLYAHDYDMLIRMADRFEVVYYQEPLVKWRWLNNGISGTKRQDQFIFAELARIRSKASKRDLTLDLKKEYKRLLSDKNIIRGINQNRPLSASDYYYYNGIMLFERGEPRKARHRFLRALKDRDDFNIFLRTLVFYTLTFFPTTINSKPVRALRKVF